MYFVRAKGIEELAGCYVNTAAMHGASHHCIFDVPCAEVGSHVVALCVETMKALVRPVEDNHATCLSLDAASIADAEIVHTA